MSTIDVITISDRILLLGERIKAYRLAARMSQAELAEKAHMSLSTLRRMEQGDKPNITLVNFLSILKIFGRENFIDDILPELPMPMKALEAIYKSTRKRIKRQK